MTRPAALYRVVCWLCLGVALAGAWMAIVPRDARAVQGLHHDLAVRLDPVTRELLAEDTFAVQGSASVDFMLARRFVVERVLVDGVLVTATPQSPQAQRNGWQVPVAASPQARTVVVRYRGRLDPLPAADYREVLGGLPPTADVRGSFLPGGTGWYPEVGTAPFTYRVSLDLPPTSAG